MGLEVSIRWAPRLSPMVLCEGSEGVEVMITMVFVEIKEVVVFSCSGGWGGRSFLPDSVPFTSSFKFSSVEASASALLSLGGLSSFLQVCTSSSFSVGLVRMISSPLSWWGRGRGFSW